MAKPPGYNLMNLLVSSTDRLDYSVAGLFGSAYEIDASLFGRAYKIDVVLTAFQKISKTQYLQF